MSGVNAGVSASYGNENTDTTSNTRSTSDSSTMFQSLLRELANSSSTQTTDLPTFAKRGMKQQYAGDVESQKLARGFLTSLLGNPYSNGANGQATGPFAGAIGNMFSSALAKARTGNVNEAGVARQGFMEGGALEGVQNNLMQQGTAAANSLLTNANPNSILGLISSVAPKKTTSTSNKQANTSGTSNTNTTGTSNTVGNSNTSNWGVGGSVGCCFIFLEAYNGILPDHVRRCRDQFVTDMRRDGYNLLAAHLVPKMKKNKWWRRAVNWLMVKPLSQVGGWLYATPGYRFGWLCLPSLLWLNIFNAIGKELKFRSPF